MPIRWVQFPKQELECIRNVASPESLYKCISDTDTPAICSTIEGMQPLTHKGLRHFLCGVGNLQRRGIGPQDVVGIVMPNGPELATALITCMSQCIAAPVEPAMTTQEFTTAFQQMGIKHVIALQDHRALGDASLDRACDDTPCKLHYVMGDSHSGTAGVFNWVTPSEHEAPTATPQFSQAHDTALVLMTSGTTSKPKLVPLTVEGLYTGAICTGRGLALTSADICLNVMPYTHIGGISCNLLATLFSGGGSVICAAAFDPTSFLIWLEKLKPTWYYAVPTIHKAVCLCVRSSNTMIKHCLRFIRSGAAHLGDADAREIRKIFKCQVLPTYAMTECMPIAQPPLEYDLAKQGSVGQPISSSMRIVDGRGHAVQLGQIGEIAIQGPVVTHGYLDDMVSNETFFFDEGGVHPGSRWFRTGDVGYLDEDGYVFLQGRYKELIKRGGEQVSPYEVEDVLLSHEAVQLAVVFGVPNPFWGEEVAAAVELKYEAKGTIATGQLIKFAAENLPNSKVPIQIIELKAASELPKTRTGNYLRAGLAMHLGVNAADLTHTGSSTGQASKMIVKPHKSTQGLRYLFALRLVYVHVGPENLVWLSMLKTYSFSVPGCFLLAGFLLASSTSEPIRSKLQFYKHRIAAAHPLYLLAALFSIPLTILVCPPGRAGMSSQLQEPCTFTLSSNCPAADPAAQGNYWAKLLYQVVNVFFGQLAWPWGLPVVISMGFMNIVMWFSSAYYFCLICFPFFYNWMHSQCLLGNNPKEYLARPFVIRFLCWPVVSFGALSPIIVLVGWNLAPILVRTIGGFIKDSALKSLVQGHSNSPDYTESVASWFGYTFPVTWACIFFLGMLLAKLFELNRSGSGIYKWRHWGKLTDLTTCFMCMSLCVGPLLWVLDPKYKLTMVHGDPVWTPEGPAMEVAELWGGGQNANGCKFVTFLLCLWIYGLAVGQGCTAKILGSDYVVKYLAPAAYPVYLFHFPTAMYWSIFKLKMAHTCGLHHNPKSVETALSVGVGLVDYFMIVLLSTLIAMLAMHKINTPLTSLFLRLVDVASYCGRAPMDTNMTTFDNVVVAVQGLSGIKVDASTHIAECGLDSFGTSALLGMLKPKLRLLTVTPLEVYKLQTIGDLVKRIDHDLCNAGWASAASGSFCEKATQPFVALDSCVIEMVSTSTQNTENC